MAGDLADGESTQVKGSGSAVYTLKNSGGVYSCSCPAWMHQSVGIERRTCKHLRAYRGDEAETQRLGSAPLTGRPPRPPGEVDETEGPPVLLAHRWENDVELTGWWLSEKLDGVRAWWDGERFLSRLGNEFFPPPWFVEKLPKTPLDGELWGGRKQFQRTVGIVKRQDRSPLWKDLDYVVFDAPKHGGPFEERLAFLEQLVGGLGVKWVKACAHVRCEGIDHLHRELARVEALGGEGLMLRKPGSHYEAGRSNTLLKVKNFHDAEARVVGHVAGAGRHKGRLGALEVELADGTRFNVGTGFSDAERERPPAIGAVITFRYQELSDGGVPRFPSFVGERIDGRLHSAPLSGVTSRQAKPERTPQGGRNMSLRRFELTDGDTRYFWEIETQGLNQKVRFGTFEAKDRLFEDADEARRDAEERIAEKLGKGFAEVAVSGGAEKKKSPFDDEDAPKAAAPKASAAPKPQAAAAPAAAPAAAAPAAASGKSSKGDTPGARYFEFVQGSSAKFWEVRVEGSSFFTRYGKIGTDGQMTQKDYASEDKAQAEAEKLIAEKTKKGYVEK